MGIRRTILFEGVIVVIAYFPPDKRRGLWGHANVGFKNPTYLAEQARSAQATVRVSGTVEEVYEQLETRYGSTVVSRIEVSGVGTVLVVNTASSDFLHDEPAGEGCVILLLVLPLMGLFGWGLRWLFA